MEQVTTTLSLMQVPLVGFAGELVMSLGSMMLSCRLAVKRCGPKNAW